MEIICQYDACTGCQACRIVCPKQCISMQEDARGNIYPVVDKTLCIDCKKCQNICPSLKPPSFSEKPLKVYAGWAKDKEARKYSTSGGISYALSKYFLENGHFFCGVVWTKEGAIHKISSHIEDIKLFQGSKYSHSDVKDCYKDISQLLKSDKRVLFTGTPCQVAALRNYLKKDYTNLFTVDIICHGVPSRRILRDHIRYIEDLTRKKVVEMRFRDKQPDQLRTCCKYMFEDGTFVLYEYTKDFFFRSFVDNYALRENCFHCNYSKLQRVSDLTIADFWGYLPKSLKFLNCELGVSIIIVNNEKGGKLVDFIRNDIIFEKRDYKECDNLNMYQPQPKPADYEDYWRDYENENVSRSEIQTKYLTEPQTQFTFGYRARKYINIFLPDFIINNIKKLMKKLKKY